MRRVLLCAALPFLVAACASSGSAGGGGGGSTITAEEIAAVDGAQNAYDVVQRLRPRFLRSRGTSSMRSAGPEGTSAAAPTGSQFTAVVYVDGVRMGGPEALRNVPSTILQSITYVSGTDATTRYGTGHGGGVIEVVTKR